MPRRVELRGASSMSHCTTISRTALLELTVPVPAESYPEPVQDHTERMSDSTYDETEQLTWSEP